MIKSLFASLVLSTGLIASDASDIQTLLEQGQFDKAIKVHAHPPTNQSTFTKALCQLTNSVETLQQELYSYGLAINSSTAGIRALAPVPPNPNPQIVDYTKIRSLIETFHEDLHTVEQTLTTIGEDDFHLPLDLTKVRFDIDRNEKYTETESSLAIFLNIESSGQLDRRRLDAAQKFNGTIGFDKSDLLWLKGYIQVCLGVTDLVLAHDFEKPFDAISSNLFLKPKNAMRSLGADEENFGDIANLIATLHLSKMTVTEPERLKMARQHLLNMVACSREMWTSILSEEDNNYEWLPSPTQNSVTGIKMTKSMVMDWHTFLLEYENILNGKTLVPHWRFKNKGINLKRVLEESTETDIILWVTGHAAVPFLEDGNLSNDELWRQLNRTFNGNFLGMSFFIN